MEFDKDLTARQEARELARRAETAQRKLAELSQSQLDAIVEAVAKAFAAQASALAEMAVQETGFGNAEDKRAKNLFASQRVAEAVRGMRTVGILREVPEKKLWEIGVPVGVIAAIVPSTNPTSTVCYKAMIALKSGNAIRVFRLSPNGHCLRPGKRRRSYRKRAGGGRACRRGGVPEHPLFGRLSGADEGGAGAADSRHRRPGYGEGGVFFRQARHRCRRGKRPCLYPPQRGCRPCSGLYRKVKVL